MGPPTNMGIVVLLSTLKKCQRKRCKFLRPVARLFYCGLSCAVILTETDLYVSVALGRNCIYIAHSPTCRLHASVGSFYGNHIIFNSFWKNESRRASVTSTNLTKYGSFNFFKIVRECINRKISHTVIGRYRTV